jgi:hypothetical protein
MLILYSSFFHDRELFQENESLRQELLGLLDVPEFVANRACTELNGYFGCKPTYDTDKKVKSCSMLEPLHIDLPVS